MRNHRYFAYMLTNCSRHPIYTGVTRAMQRRHNEHKNPVEEEDSYTSRYNLYRLVFAEQYKYINNAIRREKQIKRWSRKKKIALIESVNPKWDDLSREWGKLIDFKEICRRAERKQNQDPSTSLRSARDDKSKVKAWPLTG